MRKIIVLAMFIVSVVMMAGEYAFSATELPTIDKDGYTISMEAVDSPTGRDITRDTTIIRRLYSITNRSNRRMTIARFRVTGFNLSNAANTRNYTAGVTQWFYNYDNIVIPPHSTKFIGIYDHSSLSQNPDRIVPGYYVGTSYVTLFFSLTDLSKNINVQVDSFVNVK